MDPEKKRIPHHFREYKYQQDKPVSEEKAAEKARKREERQ